MVAMTPNVSSDDSRRALFTVWRIDDNGNTFVVRQVASRDEAERLVAEYTARGHKQTYWAEPETSTT
jgi:hypothetical protein